MDNAGKELLPMEYDTIYGLVPYEYQSNAYFVLKKDEQYTLYDKLQRKILPYTISKPEKFANTCAYRFEDLNNKGHFGFIGLSMDMYGGEVNATHFFPPLYLHVYNVWTQEACEVSVEGENGYGLIDAATGDTICPLIFKHSVHFWSVTNSPKLVICKDPKGIDSTIYYYPATGKQISTGTYADVEFRRSDSSLFVFTHFVTDDYGLLELYDFKTGNRLYHSRVNYQFQDLKFERKDEEFLSSNLYMIRTEHTKKSTGQPFFTISVYDLEAKTRVYHCVSSQFYTLETGYYKNQKAYLLVRRNGPKGLKPAAVFNNGNWIWKGDR